MAVDTNILPAPDDLAGWKAAENVLTKRISERVQSSNLVNRGTLRQFFGCKDEEHLLEEYADWSVMHAFIEWLVSDYRPTFRSSTKGKKDKIRQRRKGTRRGKTLAEKMLAAGLPAAEAKILEACSQAHPSLFRIDSVEAGSSLTVDDILLGGKIVIHDKMLSGCVEAGQCLTGRVFPVGGFHFYSPMGPPLSNFMVMEAVEYLESLGVNLTREGLIRDTNKFGWLWRWYDERAAKGHIPRLCNTDGEELIWHTASFSVLDERIVTEALANRPDVDYDDEAEGYVWCRQQDTDARILGETLSLGRIHFVLDELILDVNSAERFEAARKWLEQLPGVKYLDVKTQDSSEGPVEVPMDDRIGPKETVAMTPELTSHLQESFRQHYMGWLDSPLPMLGGKTPRQMCGTETGRKKMAMLIRTIPNPVGNQGVAIDVPRDEMLRELGLQTE